MQKQIQKALSIIVNLEAQLTNMVGRSGRAAKYWENAAKAEPNQAEVAGAK